MYKNQKYFWDALKVRDNRDPAYSVNLPSHSPKIPFKRPFQADTINRSMENNKCRYSEKHLDQSPTQKLKAVAQPAYFSQEGLVLTRNSKLPNYEPTRCSSNENGIIRAYAANTNQGIVRDYNEDRVSIILNIVKPQNRQHESWPRCSFFGVYDGHGGSACADFLRDNLHQFVIKELDFPWNPYEALRKGFAAAEQYFQDYAISQFNKGIPERSGSCAIVALLVGDVCYVANVGDSRAVLCGGNNKSALPLSRDHKPCDELEKLRIQKAGGKIYQTQQQQDDQQVFVGPLRVLPGRLSVSRTFGDIEAKLERFGGKPNVVVAEPELRSFKVQEDHQYIVLASDGIFDKMSSNEVVDIMTKELDSNSNIHQGCSIGVEQVLKESINRRTLDNITVVVVAFQGEQMKRLKNEIVKRNQIKKAVQAVLCNQEDQENTPGLINTYKRYI
ncbi:unnamed protein product [Paramecium pentaurelia]|uniref:protein-serine/threonine phosphatase n=1 Tax=Paramecium pentaurelia TaxID=43138 RepID=A0A8S1U8U5_9CILI|nr:unnamed protein product [Paramecium pentaurelia]